MCSQKAEDIRNKDKEPLSICSNAEAVRVQIDQRKKYVVEEFILLYINCRLIHYYII